MNGRQLPIPFGIVFFPRYFEYFDAWQNALFQSRVAGNPKAEGCLRRFKIGGHSDLVEAERCPISMVGRLSSYRTKRLWVGIMRRGWGTSSFHCTHLRCFRGAALRLRALKKRVVWTGA